MDPGNFPLNMPWPAPTSDHLDCDVKFNDRQEPVIGLFPKSNVEKLNGSRNKMPSVLINLY